MWPILVGALALLSTLIWAQNRKKEPPKILGIYSQPGRWYYLKCVLFYLLLKAQRFLNKSGNGGLGRDLKGSLEKWDRPQQMSEDDKAFDAVFFHAVNQDGWYLAAGAERRHMGKINGLFYLGTPDLGLLMNPLLPKTEMDANPLAIYNMKEYSAEGMVFKPVKPMKVWSISYEGKMRLQKDPLKLVDVKFEAEWSTDLPHFLFDADMDACVLARSFSTEKWSKEFFENLKRAHQTHYEQMGRLVATVTINSVERQIEMEAFRDHSFGHKRDWTLMHRYIYHVLHLKDGTRISVGVVSQPCTSSHLEMGYILLPNKDLYPIKGCSLKLYQHGENGTPPQSLAFSITTAVRTYRVKVDVEFEEVHYKGSDKEAKMVERFVRCLVNGVEGRGVSEWHYNHAEYK